MPDDLALQIEPIIEAVKLLGWPVLTVPGIEADDAIGTISCMAAKGGFKVVISTGDKDLAQLVDDNVTLINTMSNERLDVEGVAAKFGVPPERIVDYLALIGDSVDNIPGVDKVGPKTAAKWIAEHGSLEGVIAAAPTDEGRRRREPAQGARLAAAGPPPGHRRDRLRPRRPRPRLARVRRAGAARASTSSALLAFYDRYGFASMRKELETALGRTARRARAAPRRAGAARAIDAPTPRCRRRRSSSTTRR